MRILTFGLSAYTRGGIEAFVLTFSKYMKEDCIFDYVFLEDKNSIPEYEENGSRLFFLTPDREHPIKYCIELIKLLREIKDSIDVAYYNMYSPVHVLPLIICRLMRMKVVVHAHNRSMPPRSRFYNILSDVGRKIINQGKCLQLTNSKESATFLFGKEASAHLIYNAIEVERFKFDELSRKRTRQELGTEGKIVVGFVGRLFEEKNPLFALEVFEEFHRNNTESALLIVGEGQMKSTIHKQIDEKGLEGSVIFLGVRTDMPILFHAMDVLLMPSLSEGLGIVLLEAQASGLPCLASADVIPDIVNVTELISRESLFSTASEWAKKLSTIIERKYKNRGTYNNMISDTRFNIKTEANNFVSVIKKYLYESSD